MTSSESPRFPYGEFPAHHPRFGDVELSMAVLVVRRTDADLVVLIGSCQAADYQGPRACSAEAGGYRWTFNGSVFEEQPQDEGRVRLRIRSEGAFTAEPIATEGK